MRLTLRADASTAIGYGHLSRAVALGTAATRRGLDVRLVSCRPDSSMRAFVAGAPLALHSTDAAPGSEEDAQATRDVSGAGSIVIVDGYAFEGPYLAKLGGEDRTVVYVDDLFHDRLPCDVVLDPNVSASTRRYRTPRETSLQSAHSPTYLLGPSYAIVADRFVEARALRVATRPHEPETTARLLVTMGGSDPPGATLAVINALGELNLPRMTVRIVVGGANPRRDLIRGAAAASTLHDVEVRDAVADMAAEMSWADLVVTASGVTSTELACIGVAGLSLPIVTNQEPIAAAQAKLGLYEVLAIGSRPPDIRAAIERLAPDRERRAALVERQRQTIDGQGKERILDRLLAFHAQRRHNH